MSPADLRRYHRLLLKKQCGVSSALGEAQSRVPAAGGLEGDLIEQANADEEAELQIYLHQTEGRLARAIRRGPRSDPEAHLRGVRSVRTSYFKSPVGRRSLETALPRVQGAKEHLRTVCGQAQHSHA